VRFFPDWLSTNSKIWQWISEFVMVEWWSYIPKSLEIQQLTDSDVPKLARALLPLNYQPAEL